MLSDTRWGLILRILLAGILIALLNLAPRPHAMRQALDQARQALQREDLAAAFNHTALAAKQAPWRFDLSLLRAAER
jgi:hypothetical protein